MLSNYMPSEAPKRAKSISLSKCPMFPTNAMFTFTRSKVMVLARLTLLWKQNVEFRHDGLDGHNANGGAGMLLEDGTDPPINAPSFPPCN